MTSATYSRGAQSLGRPHRVTAGLITISIATDKRTDSTLLYAGQAIGRLRLPGLLSRRIEEAKLLAQTLADSPRNLIPRIREAITQHEANAAELEQRAADRNAKARELAELLTTLEEGTQ